MGLSLDSVLGGEMIDVPFLKKRNVPLEYIRIYCTFSGSHKLHYQNELFSLFLS